jgi:hypothetical protein
VTSAKVILGLGLGAQIAVQSALSKIGWGGPRLVYTHHPVSAMYSKAKRAEFEREVQFACTEAGITPVFRGALRLPPGPPAVIPPGYSGCQTWSPRGYPPTLRPTT